MGGCWAKCTWCMVPSWSMYWDSTASSVEGARKESLDNGPLMASYNDYRTLSKGNSGIYTLDMLLNLFSKLLVVARILFSSNPETKKTKTFFSCDDIHDTFSLIDLSKDWISKKIWILKGTVSRLYKTGVFTKRYEYNSWPKMNLLMNLHASFFEHYDSFLWRC